ncbi:hypothetical protein PHMEG_00021670 [Phytophthora megakarya]|uniref:DDE-1 domain-containing protein n=1 Tax=Phytophthora megakarya TaxID=4795 RepID=A0A225VLA7_9STRA|nr:hypothetical protein PHMEG_00021670 [Phytophthora megakarya]
MELDRALRGSKGHYGHTVDFFPALFRSSDRRVNLNKARDWWKKREQTAVDTERNWVRTGCGCTLSYWRSFNAYAVLESKISNHLVAEIDIAFIEDSEHPMFFVRYTVKGTPFADLMTPRRVQDFLERNNIVYRSHMGKQQVSVKMQMQIDMAVAKHLGALKRQFEDGTLLPDQQYNMDESHFIIDLDDDKTLDFVGSQSVKYRGIVSVRRKDITMCVLLKGGSDARILCPMLIFKNKSYLKPTRYVTWCVLQDLSKCIYQRTLMAEWLREPRCWGTGGPFASSRVLWMDNASGHCGSEMEDAARELRTKMKYVPASATDKVQPADLFPIRRIKEHWRRLAERRNMDAIQNGDWKTGTSSSGKLANPGKNFFLELAAECIRLVHLEKDKNGDNWTKKSMIQCGLVVSRDGV